MDDTPVVGLIRPEDGQHLFNPIGGAMTVKVGDAATHDGFSVFDNIVPASTKGPRLHRHLRHDEVFYVIAGTLTVEIEGEIVTAPAGSFVLIPRGMAHRPSNATPEPTHVLVLFSPGGMDTFFSAVAANRIPLAGPFQGVDADVFADFCARYGFAFADDPPPT